MQNLDCELFVEHLVAYFVYRAHAAFRQLAEKFVFVGQAGVAAKRRRQPGAIIRAHQRIGRHCQSTTRATHLTVAVLIDQHLNLRRILEFVVLTVLHNVSQPFEPNLYIPELSSGTVWRDW